MLYIILPLETTIYENDCLVWARKKDFAIKRLAEIDAAWDAGTSKWYVKAV